MLQSFVRILFKKAWIDINLLTLLGAVVWAEYQQQRKRIGTAAITIVVPQQPQQTLLTVAEVSQCLQEHAFVGEGAPTTAHCLGAARAAVTQHSFVRDTQVYKDWHGALHVRVYPRHLIARFVTPDGQSQYLDDTGTWVPLCAHYTPHVPLVYTKRLPEKAVAPELLQLLRFIEAHSFWRAQVAALQLLPKGEVAFTTQMGHQQVLLGQVDDFAAKLAKLYVCYRRILSAKGWKRYRHINLKFKDQIICT